MDDPLILLTDKHSTHKIQLPPGFELCWLFVSEVPLTMFFPHVSRVDHELRVESLDLVQLSGATFLQDWFQDREWNATHVLYRCKKHTQ